MNQTLHHRIRATIDTGFESLKHTQEPDGSFRGTARLGTGQETSSETVFTTALILNALGLVTHHPALRHIADDMCIPFTQAATFIQHHQTSIGSWNYWLPEATGKQLFPCPNDIDDTVLALAAIKLHDPAWFDGTQTAKLAKMLTSIERGEGGPYNTWLVDYHHDTRWDDCDIAVNANIAYLLHILDISLPNLDTWFATAIAERSLTSKYYFSPITILYFISRSHTSSYHDQAVQYIHELQQPDNTWGSPLVTALALTALYNFGEDISLYHTSINYLLATQNEDGLWPQEDLYVEYHTSDGVWHHGSPSLTTACCLETLILVLGRANTTATSTRFTDEARQAFEDLLARAEACSPEFVSTMTKPLEKIMTHSVTRDSVVAPYFFAEALGININTHQSILHDLTVAALAGWSGYTLIDDSMDNQVDTKSLPQAVFLLRVLIEQYTKHFQPTDYRLVEIVLQQTDQAYYDERVLALPHAADGHSFLLTSLPAPEKVPSVEKSLGHVLPLLGVLSAIEYPNKGHIRHTLVDFFTLYLQGRQTNDDMHDIIDDLSHGRLTPTNTAVLHAWHRLHPDENQIDVTTETTTLLHIFWEGVFPTINETLLAELHHARSIAAAMPIPHPEYFVTMVDMLINLQKQAATEQQFTKDFLAAY